jgi:eukaryotic-like serine/threonine-protein kinase
MRVQRASSDGFEVPGPITRNLPPAVVERVAQRLCWVTVFVATSAVVLTAGDYLLQSEFAVALRQNSLRLTLLGLAVLSVAFVVAQVNGWLTKAQLLDFGLIYQVAVSFVIAMCETSMQWNVADPVRGHSGINVWMLLCGFLLPNAPLRVGVTAALSIATWPLAYWLNVKINGLQPLPPERIAVWMMPMLVTGVWMYMINRRVISMQIREYKAEQLGSYQLDSLIGKGGMGEVWRARHKMLSRDAAVKLIRREVLQASSGKQEAVLLKRFEREAQATARLSSPHTVALYDYGETKEGTIYYVMELLRGIDLQSMVERFGPMPAGRVVNIMRDICESLEEAHRAGLVHRDIKPKNILLCQVGLQYDFVKVLDFGLVKMRRRREETLVSMEGITTGTPAYMAPEVAIGKENVDGRADLYSLGCTAYFLLTGQLVFDEGSGVGQVIAHAQKTPMVPSERTELPIPVGLELIVMRLLEKEPEKRFRSAHELGRALRALKGISEFCPYTAEDWWNSNLPELTRNLDETFRPQAVVAKAGSADAAIPAGRR